MEAEEIRIATKIYYSTGNNKIKNVSIMKETNNNDAQALLNQVNASAEEMAGWLKGFGVLNIIIGIPSLLFLVGALNIFLGWVLYQAGKAAGNKNPKKVNVMMSKIKTYFAVMTILTSIGIVFSVIGFAIAGTAIMNAFSAMPQ